MILFAAARGQMMGNFYLLFAIVFLASACAELPNRDVRRAVTLADISTISSYSPAVEYRGELLFVSGNIAYKDGAMPAYAADGVDDIKDQTKIVMDNLNDILATAGYAFDDVLKVSVFLADIDHFTAFNEVYRRYWQADVALPAREAVQVAALPGSKPNAKVLIEISMIAGR